MLGFQNSRHFETTQIFLNKIMNLSKMAFITRQICKAIPGERPPVKAYFHEAGFQDVFGGDVANAQSYLLQAFHKQRFVLTPFDYIIAAVWGDVKTGDRVVDVFGYSDIHPWRTSNPDSDPYEIRNETWQPLKRMCEDTQVILGREGEFRRQTDDLADFMRRWPDLPAIVWQPLRQLLRRPGDRSSI